MKKRLTIALVIAAAAVFLAAGLFLSRQKKEIKIENSLIQKQAELLGETEKSDTKPEESLENTEKDVKSLAEEAKEDEIQPSEEKTETKKVEETGSDIEKDLVSWGFSSAKSRKIDTIILHSSYNALSSDPYDFSELLREYKEYGVAPHYVIDRDAKIHLLVAENNVAYHAGVSQMPDGRTNVNEFSIGIEIVGKEKDKITTPQYNSINILIAQIKKRYEIKYVLGHSDIAPDRKTDPWNLDWDKVKK